MLWRLCIGSIGAVGVCAAPEWGLWHICRALRAADTVPCPSCTSASAVTRLRCTAAVPARAQHAESMQGTAQGGKPTCVQDDRASAFHSQSTACEAAVCIACAWAGLQGWRLVRPVHQVLRHRMAPRHAEGPVCAVWQALVEEVVPAGFAIMSRQSASGCGVLPGLTTSRTLGCAAAAGCTQQAVHSAMVTSVVTQVLSTVCMSRASFEQGNFC